MMLSSLPTKQSRRMGEMMARYKANNPPAPYQAKQKRRQRAIDRMRFDKFRGDESDFHRAVRLKNKAAEFMALVSSLKSNPINH